MHLVSPTKTRGFTLIEMIVVVAIVGVLTAAAQPMMALASRRARESELRQGLRQLRTAIDAYKQAALEHRISVPENASGYPPRLEALVEGAVLQAGAEGDAPATGASKVPKRVYFLRKLPRDPFADPALPAAQTWGLRAYDSPPEQPRAGRDVFDVYSLSEGTALDGSAYRDW